MFDFIDLAFDASGRPVGVARYGNLGSHQVGAFTLDEHNRFIHGVLPVDYRFPWCEETNYVRIDASHVATSSRRRDDFSGVDEPLTCNPFFYWDSSASVTVDCYGFHVTSSSSERIDL